MPTEPIILSDKLHLYRGPEDDGYIFWCPGCREVHQYIVRSDGNRPAWTFNGNAESPSFEPSLLHPRSNPTRDPRFVGRCHLFVRNGMIEYCSDCEHDLAGKTVPMETLDNWPDRMDFSRQEKCHAD